MTMFYYCYTVALLFFCAVKRPRLLEDYEEEVSSDGDESEGDIFKEKV